MSKFSLGEVCIFSIPSTAAGIRLAGTEVIIIEYSNRIINKDPETGVIEQLNSVYVFESIDGEGVCEEFQLSKLPPPDTLSTWEDCVFKPAEVKA